MYLNKVILFMSPLSICNAFFIFGNSTVNKAECCIQDEWEGNIVIDSGHVYYDQDTFMAYLNGTMHVAYSMEEHKFYYDMHIIEQTPLLPEAQKAHIINLRDYKKGVSYTVTDGECQKENIEQKMSKQCIPAGAKLLSKGRFTDRTKLTETYQFYIHYRNVPIQITATVLKTEGELVKEPACEPFFATYYIATDSIDVYMFNVMDVGPIKSKNIFNVPEGCQ